MNNKAITYSLYDKMLDYNHILICGTAGCGKSTLIDGLMQSALCRDPAPTFYLIDPKCVDLMQYRKVKLVKQRVTENEDAVDLLNEVIKVMQQRYDDMEKAEIKITNEPDIYVVVDEVADIIATHKKQVMPLLQRIAQKGRAAKIHLILATQVLLCGILSTEVRGNFDCIVAMRTATANQSRVILGTSGAEKLPKHGSAYIINPDDGIGRYKIPMIPEEEIKRSIAYWS